MGLNSAWMRSSRDRHWFALGRLGISWMVPMPYGLVLVFGMVLVRIAVRM